MQNDLFGEETSAKNSIKQLQKQDVIKLLTPFFKDNATLKIGHDVKAAMHIIEQNFSPVDDIMVMSYVLDGGVHKHDLENLAKLHLDMDISIIEELKKTSHDGIVGNIKFNSNGNRVEPPSTIFIIKNRVC